MRIVVLGAGHVGRAVLDALHEEHEITVIDVDADRLAALSDRFDVGTIEGDGTTKRIVLRATGNGCDLFIGCSSREEANLICAMLVKRVSGAQTIIRTTSAAYLEAWRRVVGGTDERVDDVVIFGAGQMGTTIARALLEREIRVRLVDAQLERAREVAETLPGARCFHAHAFDPEFLERERIGRATAAVFCLNDDARNLYGAILAKSHGVRLTIALVHDEISVDVYERGGVDVAINPRQVTAEELVRFAHDPRIRQIAMLEDDRFEILDITVLPATGSVIGAVIRNGTVLFPHKSDVLHANDRVIIFVESRRAAVVEQAL